MTEPYAPIVLQTLALSKTYRMGEVEVHALRGVDLELFEGEFIVLLGPSGSGKSTLLNILGGLDVPTRGPRALSRTTISPRPTRPSSPSYRREHVGFVFQFYNLIPSLTARENVALVTEIARDPMRARGGARARRPGRPPRSLPVAALGRRAAARRDRARDRQAARRAALRRADRRARLQTGIVVLEAIERVNRELGTTTAVITHNALDRRRWPTACVTLADGRDRGECTEREQGRSRELCWW